MQTDGRYAAAADRQGVRRQPNLPAIIELMEESFSGKRGYSAFDRPIEVRKAAPPEVRTAVSHFAVDAGLSPHAVRSVVLEVLGVPPDPKMWSTPKYVVQETHEHLTRAEWFEVYDVAEALYRHALVVAPQSAERYAERINRLFQRLGVGWKLDEGVIESRGSESFELQVARARAALSERELPTARQEVHEALLDLSRRPTPDLTGAVQHAAAAIECVAREIAGSPTPTLGDLLKRNPQLFPQPLGSALEKIWGFASERARHLREGGAVDRERLSWSSAWPQLQSHIFFRNIRDVTPNPSLQRTPPGCDWNR